MVRFPSRGVPDGNCLGSSRQKRRGPAPGVHFARPKKKAAARRPRLTLRDRGDQEASDEVTAVSVDGSSEPGALDSPASGSSPSVSDVSSRSVTPGRRLEGRTRAACSSSPARRSCDSMERAIHRNPWLNSAIASFLAIRVFSLRFSSRRSPDSDRRSWSAEGLTSCASSGALTSIPPSCAPASTSSERPRLTARVARSPWGP